MAPEVGAATGADYGKKSALHVARRNGSFWIAAAKVPSDVYVRICIS